MENRVLEVLVGDAGQPVLPAGNTIGSLAVGQIGFFDASTNLSINATSAGAMIEYYVATRVRSGVDGIIKSKKRVNGRNKDLLDVQFACPVDAQDQVIDVDLTNAKLDCEEAYALKIGLENGVIFKNAGYNFVGQTFTVSTDCCEDCNSGCGTGDCVGFVRDMIDIINSDTTGIISAQAVDRNPAVPVLITDLDAWNANVANDGLCPSIRITFSAEKLTEYCKINLMYEYLRQTKGILSFSQHCSGVEIVEVTPIRYAENYGYDINYLLYEAGGYNGNPGIYRVSDTTFSEYGNSLSNYANNDEPYCLYSITYNHESPSGWHTHKSALDIVIAMPSTATAANADVISILTQLNDGYTITDPTNCCTV